MSDPVKTLECGDCGVGFENEPGEPSQIQDGLCNACARPILLEEIKRLRADKAALLSAKIVGPKDLMVRIDAALAEIRQIRKRTPVNAEENVWLALKLVEAAIQGEKP